MVPLQEALVGALAVGMAFLLLVRADERARDDDATRIGQGPVTDARGPRKCTRQEE